MSETGIGGLTTPIATHPKVALRSPPNASPTRMASSSVAKPRMAANGTMAALGKSQFGLAARSKEDYGN